MAFVIADRVRETTTTTGTGTITLGGAVTNFETFAANLSNADTTYYAIVDNTNSDFEVGVGTFTSSGTTLARSVIASSNSNNLVDFGAGTKDVFITVPASKIVVEDGSNNVSVGGDVSVGDDLTVLGGVIDFKSNSGSPASLKMYCESSNAHFQTLQPQPHSASASNTLRLPNSGSSDTQDLVAVDVTQTLTNKTLTTPTLTNPTISGLSLADSHAGTYGSSSSPIVLTVTVASKSGHPYQGDGSGNAYVINGVQAPALTLHGADNETSSSEYYYRFDQSDSSNSGHPLRFYLDAARNTEYTTGVTNTGSSPAPGNSGAYTQIAVDENTPKVLYYQCTNHAYMGNYAVTLSSNHISSGSTITLDAKTDIILDAGGADVTLKDDGTTYGSLTNSSGELVIKSGSTPTTALTFSGANVTVAGDLTVSGTTTTVDSTTINVQNTLVFEGSTANDHETTLTTVDPTADRTISLPNQSGTLPVLAAASTTQITSTPEELNILDGVTATASELNILDGVTATTAEVNLLDGDTSVGSSITIADSDGIIVNDGGTMKSVPASDVKTYAAGDSASKGFATAMAIAL